MPSLKQIKTRIKSTQNLKKITKALEVVSTVKLQKNKKKTESLRDYFMNLSQLVMSIGSYTNLFDTSVNPSWNKRLIILVSSDKWLCWSSNSKLFRTLHQHYPADWSVDIFVIGKKWLEFAVRSWYSIVGNIILWDEYTQQDLLSLFAYIQEYQSTYSSISIAHNFFKNTLVQLPQVLQIYPLHHKQIDDLFGYMGRQTWYQQLHDETLIEPSISEINTELLRQIRQYMIIAAIAQSKLTEHANRMVAMKSAKDNCSQLIGWLTLQYNKARQAIITKEISEIVAAKIAIEW